VAIILKRLFSHINVKSQRLSEYLKGIKKEKYLRKFFTSYLGLNYDTGETLLIDTTALYKPDSHATYLIRKKRGTDSKDNPILVRR